MWPWESDVKDSWKCKVALLTLVVGLSERAQHVVKLSEPQLNARFTFSKPKEIDLHKLGGFPQDRLLAQTMFAQSPLDSEARIKTLPLEVQQIIVTKVWQHRTIIEGTEEIKDFGNFVKKENY